MIQDSEQTSGAAVRVQRFVRLSRLKPSKRNMKTDIDNQDMKADTTHMKNKLNVSKAQTSHWVNVANWAIESGNDGVKDAGRKVLAIAKAGGNVMEHCRSAYEIALRVWTN